MSRQHSQHRIIGALRLAPMNQHQLELCLSLHRVTVSRSLNALEHRRRVRRRPGTVRHDRFGPIAPAFELITTIDGGTP